MARSGARKSGGPPASSLLLSEKLKIQAAVNPQSALFGGAQGLIRDRVGSEGQVGRGGA